MTDLSFAPSLRIALAMRGGVSLSVWIGGGVHEIERFRHDVILGGDDKEGSVLATIARAVEYTSVEVDVISGASAGGLNAVILGTAMTNGKSLDLLRDVWLNSAAIEHLVYKSSHGVRLSILDGDYFYEQLVANLHDLMSSVDGDPRLRADRADVLLSVTSIVPLPVSAAPDPSAPVTEQRIGGQIHLRRRKPGHDEECCCAPAGIDDFAVERIDDLALSARSTASFPVAFQPVKVDEHRMVGNIDFRPQRPVPLLLFDGGVSDNMPVGKAATAIGSAPADGPTNRVLLYLHPSPGVPDVAAAARQVKERRALAQEGARPLDVLKTSLRSLRTKSLVEDLQALEAHNANVDKQLRDRDRLLEPFLGTGPADGLVAALQDLEDAVDEVLEGAMDLVGVASPTVVAPSLDAERLVDLFVEPWEHVADLVPPMEFAPRLGGWSDDDLDQLQMHLTSDLASVNLEGAAALPALSAHSLRPWGAVIRSASLLIEWCRWAESIGFEGVSVPKRKVYEIREHAYRRASCLNAQTLAELRALPPSPAAAALAIVDARRPFVEAQLDDVAVQWSELASLAVDIRASAPSVQMSMAGERGGRLHLVFDRLFPEGSDASVAREALDRLDRAFLPLHRGAPIGSLDRVEYHTISGSAGTPLATEFPWPAPACRPELSFSSLRPLPCEPTGGTTLNFDPSRIDPGSKLAGNQLHNFSAFLERRWRANDWMWGQIDAASTIVDLVLDPGRLQGQRREYIEKIVAALHESCTRPLATRPSPGRTAVEHRWSGVIVEAATRLWSDEVTTRVIDELMGDPTPGPEPYPLARALVLWRRHLEIVVAELDHDAADNPTGSDAAPTLSESMADWDASPRQLSAVWGEAKITAIGMRAVFVGWRALFARAPRKLGLVRALLAPILAPVAGFVLCRRRTAFVLELFLIGCVMPRASHHVGGRVAIAGFGVALGLYLLFLTRDVIVQSSGKVTRKFDLFTEGWSLMTLVLMVVLVTEAVFVSWSWFSNVLPDARRADGGVLPYALPVGAVMVITFVTWYWAKLRWRVLVSLVDGGIVWFWVWFGASAACIKHNVDYVGGAIAFFGSFWWAIGALLIVTTLLGYNWDFADLD
jgi:hypothetical protein